jgi:hypothetical protein
MGIIAGMTPATQTRADFYFKPNMELLNQALAVRQKDYDTKLAGLTQIKAKLDEVNALEGFDKERYHEKEEEYSNIIDKVQGLHDGDLTKSSGEIQGLMNVVNKDFGVHGEFTALSNRYTGYMKNYEEITKRRKKGKITVAQEHGLHKELARTKDIGIGTDHKNYNSWSSVTLTDAINREEFLRKYVKNAKKSSEGKWGIGQNTKTTPTGVVEWRKVTGEWIDEQKLRGEAKQALRNALGRTGELEAEWIYEKDMRSGEPTMKDFEELKTNSYGTLNKYSTDIKDLNTLKGEALQNKINDLYVERTGAGILIPDGKGNAKLVKQAKAELLRVLQTDETTAQENYSNLAGMPEENRLTYASNHLYNKFIDGLLDDEVRPYSGTASMKSTDEELKTMVDQGWKFQRKLDLIRLTHSYKLKEIKYEFDLDQPEFVKFSKLTAGQKIERPWGKDLVEFGKKKEELITAGGATTQGFWQRILQGNPGGDVLEGQAKNDGIAKLMKEHPDISYEDIAAAKEFKKDGSKLVMVTKTGKEVVLSENSNLSTKLLYQSQSAANNVVKQLKKADDFYNYQKSLALNDPNNQFSDEEKTLITDGTIDKTKNRVQQNSKELFNLYKQNGGEASQENFNKAIEAREHKMAMIAKYMGYTGKTLGQFVDALPPGFGRIGVGGVAAWGGDALFQASNKLASLTGGDPAIRDEFNQFTTKEGAFDYTSVDILNELSDMQKANPNVGTVDNQIREDRKTLRNHSDIVRKITDAINKKYDASESSPLSIRASNNIFTIGGVSAKTALARNKAVVDHFQDKETTDGTAFQFSMTNEPMTPADYIEKVLKKSADKVTYSVGKEVLADEDGYSWVMPVTFYGLDENGKATDIIHQYNDARVDFEDGANWAFTESYRNDPYIRNSNYMKEVITSGLPDHKQSHTSPSLGLNYNITTKLGTDDRDNTDINNYVRNSSAYIEDYPIPQWLDSDGKPTDNEGQGFIQVKEVTRNGKKVLERVYKKLKTGWYTFEDADKIRREQFRQEEVYNDIRRSGIGKDYVHYYRPIVKDGKEEYETFYKDRYHELRKIIDRIEENTISADEAMREADALGVNNINARRLLSIVQERVSYKTVKDPHPYQINSDSYSVTNKTTKIHR